MTPRPHARPAHTPAPTPGGYPPPRLIALELTRRCPLACRHCRAAAGAEVGDELSTADWLAVLDNIASFARPIVILTGGEPMTRPDVYDIASHGTSLGLSMAMAPCGTLIDDDSARRVVQSGIRRISISLDGATARSHDAFRGVEGAFDGAIRGLQAARRAGLEFQINTTITSANIGELDEIMALAVRLGAGVFNPFLLVPTGRGRGLAHMELTPRQYEETLNRLADAHAAGTIPVRVTCAPHYQRVLRQRGLAGDARQGRGCMGGQSFAFVSHEGVVQICGFLDVPCGDLRRERFDFARVWQTSEVFRRVRDVSSYRGRCGRCEYRSVCSGCRARAYALTGDYLQEEPFCAYEPRAAAQAHRSARDLDETDKRILDVIQARFPATARPYTDLAVELGSTETDVLARVRRMRKTGVIRRLGGVFDAASLGYVSTLVAAKAPPERLDETAGAVAELEEVTHCYGREHEYNLWFTLTARSIRRLESLLAGLRRRTGIAAMHSLPAQAIYKIRVQFPLVGAGAAKPHATVRDTAAHNAAPGASHGRGRRFSARLRELVRLLQDDLPDGPEPLAALAERAGMAPDELPAQIARWIQQGVIRRLGAVLRHQALGFQANAMVAFRVDAASAASAGAALAELPEVSHCYLRRSAPGFDYNLFAMFHGRREQALRERIDAAWARIGSPPQAVLFSRKEYKKTSPRYFMEGPDD